MQAVSPNTACYFSRIINRKIQDCGKYQTGFDRLIDYFVHYGSLQRCHVGHYLLGCESGHNVLAFPSLWHKLVHRKLTEGGILKIYSSYCKVNVALDLFSR